MEDNRNLANWFLILFVVVVTTITLLSCLPNFIGVEQVKYTTLATASTSLQEVGETSTVSSRSDTQTTVAVSNTGDTIFPLDLNTATIEQLMEVPGIGNTYAQRIIEYREEIVEFTNLEQLLDIKGIGKTRLEQWRPYLTV